MADLSKPLSPPIWDKTAELPWQPLSQLIGEISADVCVIGLGASGLSCIEHLLKLGVPKVIGIDARDVGGGAGGRNGGFLLAGIASFHHDAVKLVGRERATGMYKLTVEELERNYRRFPNATRNIGSLRIAMDDEEEKDCREQLEAMKKDGLAAEWYDGPEGRGLFVPTDGTFHPLDRVRTMAKDCIAGGAQLFGFSAVVDVKEASSGASKAVVQTTNGQITARHVIIAVDAMENVVAELGKHVRTVRLQMLSTAPAPEVKIPVAVYARYGYEYWQQRPDGRIALGGFRDKAGMEEETRNSDPSTLVQGMLEDFLRKRLGVKAEIEHRWAASVGYTDTELPFVEQAMGNVWAVGGYCGTGNIVGPILGREVAEIVVKGQDKATTPFIDLIKGTSAASRL